MAITLKTDDLYYLQIKGSIVKAAYKGSAGGTVHWFSIKGAETFLNEQEFVVLGQQETLTQPGDALQSAASRLAAGVRRVGADRALGYEDSMALREVESGLAAWTEARR